MLQATFDLRCEVSKFFKQQDFVSLAMFDFYFRHVCEVCDDYVLPPTLVLVYFV